MLSRIVCELVVMQRTGATGSAAYPVELYLLGALRMLGRNATCDCIAELTSISAESHRLWFNKFIRWYTQTQYSEFVRLPSTTDEVEECCRQYANL
jgi:hypothetical protein